jgi:glucan phosphorylase
MPNDRSIAYFTMEIALEPGMHTYSGSLGLLAGDTIRKRQRHPIDVPKITRKRK